MRPLLTDDRLHDLAALICGDGLPVYRTGSQVRALFARAGIAIPVDDRPSRLTMARRGLQQAQQSGTLDRVLAYLADPAENLGRSELASDTVQRVDQILSLRPAAPKPAVDPWATLKQFTQQAGGALRGTAEQLRRPGAMLRPSHLVVRLSLDDAPRAALVLRDSRDPSLEHDLTQWRTTMVVRTAGRTSTVTGVMQAVATASGIAPVLQPLLPDPTRTVDLSEAEFLDVVRRAKRLEKAGIVVQIPAELTPAGRRRLRMRLHVGGAPQDPTNAGIGAAALTDFSWKVTLGDDALTAAEFSAIAAAKRPLVRVRGTWVQVDPDELAHIEELLASRGTMTLGRATGVALGVEPDVDVVATGAIARLLEAVRAAPAVKDVRQPAGFKGTMRKYQRRGLAWLQHLESIGFGGVLADDMGLGKTIQLIALVLASRGATLIVCPTSVVANWEREFARFAPSMHVVRHHGPTRSLQGRTRESVVLTTYGLLRRDRSILCAIEWDRVVLDEAQHIKNPRTSVARAARDLRAPSRLALTGTPVENRLTDLWSIMEFANPGLLGSLHAFRGGLAGPVERGSEDAAQRLASVVRPFVLRRLKDEVAPDLPPKVEATTVVPLTPEQATLYQAAVDVAMEDIADAEGAKRRGKVLALIGALKQICNHPAQYLHEPGPIPGRSGKLARVTEMLEEVVDEGQAALVFTQYVEMGKLLARHLRPEPLFLHGGVPAARRRKLMDQFQAEDGPQLMVVSLRAGGTGVNLTRASHVLHFDRWWNPAVEDQATDRAHRIGQEQTVFVHRFLAAGTLEERIDALVTEKRALAGRVLSAGEAWITELDNNALRELLTLSHADVESL